MQRTPPISPLLAPLKAKATEKAKATGLQEHLRRYPQPALDSSDSGSEPGDALFDNNYAKMLLKGIKLARNGASQAYSK